VASAPLWLRPFSDILVKRCTRSTQPGSRRGIPPAVRHEKKEQVTGARVGNVSQALIILNCSLVVIAAQICDRIACEVHVAPIGQNRPLQTICAIWATAPLTDDNRDGRKLQALRTVNC
jgi:hypothetical protein